MRYLIIFLFCLGCGIKPSATCGVDLKKETMKEIKDSCIEHPQVGVKAEF